MGWFGPVGDCDCCGGGDPPLLCEMCGEVGPVTGGTIQFLDMPANLTSTVIDGSITYFFDINLDLNHSRALTFSVYEGGCCWSAPYADIGTIEVIYERYDGATRVARFRGTANLRSSVKINSSAIGEPHTCSEFGPFFGWKYIIQHNTFTVHEGAFSDSGGLDPWLWPNDCGGVYPDGNDTVSQWPFPTRFRREATGFGPVIDPAVNTGQHLLSACSFDKTLNCGFGRVIWTPS